MFSFKAISMALGIPALLLTALSSPVSAEEHSPARKDAVRIGLVNSLFRDTPAFLDRPTDAVEREVVCLEPVVGFRFVCWIMCYGHCCLAHLQCS